MLGQRALAMEAGEDSKRVDALGDPACQGDIAFAQTQHLGALDDPGVSSGARQPQSV